MRFPVVILRRQPKDPYSSVLSRDRNRGERILRLRLRMTGEKWLRMTENGQLFLSKALMKSHNFSTPSTGMAL